MRTWVLGSGSRGNAVLIEHGESRVLVDAGFPIRVLADRLSLIDVPCESIEAVIVTHEHHDHARGACAGARIYGWVVHATAGTAIACPELREADLRTFHAGAALRFTDLSVRTVHTSHDAAEPIAIVATASSGARAAVAYDLGYVPSPLRAALADLDILVVEANHDDGMLRAGPYPPSVRERIGGRRGHLSNVAAAAMVREIAHGSMSHVVLAHLSDQCNDPKTARSTVGQALRSTRFRGRLTTAPQDGIVGPLEPGRWRRAAQLDLGL